MLDICEFGMEVEAIKIALNTLHYRDLEIQPVIEQSIEFLLMQYEISNEEKYLLNAIIIISAYLSMGNLYESEKELFDRVLNYLNITREELFPRSFYPDRVTKLSKYQIRKMLGKWMPSKDNPMKIDEVVDDIMDKILQKQKGHYYYKYVRNKKSSSNATGMYSYELVITDNECFFYDVRKNKGYRFY